MKTVLVTGSNRGLGKAIADLFLERDYIVYGGRRTLTDQYQNNPNFRQVVLDITDDASIQSAVRKIKDEAGSIDILINNAGVSKRSVTGNREELVSNIDTLDRTSLLTMMDINTISHMMVVKYALPLMTNPESFIVNISSIRALFDNSADGNGNYGYSSSKLALNMMTWCLVHELPANVSTLAVHPGSVLTDMNPGGSMTPDESAQSILAILDSWSPSLNGHFLNYNGTKLNGD